MAHTPPPPTVKPTSPAIIVISSFVADGSVGGRVASFALERLGFPVWFVPTTLLPRHPGRAPSAREEPSTELLEGCLADFVTLASKRPVAAVLTGYIGNAAQAPIIANTIKNLKVIQPDLLFMCDPVMGDQSGLYVPDATAKAIRDVLWPICDFATPNTFELGWLCDQTETTTSPKILKDLAEATTPRTIAVTSVPGLMSNHIGNMLVQAERPTLLFEHLAMPQAPHGTGDLFAALLLGQFLTTKNPELATERASASLFELTARAAKSGLEDLPLIAEQTTLERPMAMVAKRIIGAHKPSTKSDKKRVVFKPSAL